MNFDESMESLNLKFTSGNRISVERATIIDKEWKAIKKEITRLGKIEVHAKKLMFHIEILLVICIILALGLVVII